MKTLTIGSTNLELVSFSKKWDKGRGVYAQIVIPTTAISYTDLKALFVDNQHDLIVTEEDGSTTSYSGYAELDEIREKADEFTVVQYCTETAMHLLNEARKQIDEQNTVIDRQNKVIDEQASQVTGLEEMSVAQLSAIDTILTEVVPSIIELAVAQAVEAVTTTNDTEPTEE